MKKIKYRLVYNRRKLLNSQRTALIQVEASLGRQKIYFNSGIYIHPDEWDKRTSSIINHPHATDLNAWLYEFVLRLEGLELSMWKRGVTPTLFLIKEASENNQTDQISFKSFCTLNINKSKRKESTKYSLFGTLSILNEFRPLYNWDDLTYSFLKDFEFWLHRKKYAVNTVGKHLRNLRTFINEAIAAGYLASNDNPFRQYTIKSEKTPHRFLNPDELHIMEKAQLNGMLAHIRDAFLFCCYTGLRFSDFKQLNTNSFTSLEGKIWLTFRTEKTNSLVKIPIYLIFDGKALNILSRYPSVEDFIQIGQNNQANKLLANLQQTLKIKTRITFHTARHTCATLLCHQGVPITTVQKILGHSNLTSTQVYSEVMADTIVRDLTNSKKTGKNRL